jgi:hypothetical protein
VEKVDWGKTIFCHAVRQRDGLEVWSIKYDNMLCIIVSNKWMKLKEFSVDGFGDVHYWNAWVQVHIVG